MERGERGEKETGEAKEQKEVEKGKVESREIMKYRKN
jgi:hypothetical protein